MLVVASSGLLPLWVGSGPSEVPEAAPAKTRAALILIEAICPMERFVRARPRRVFMPAKSAAQQKAAGAALSAKRGDTSKSKLKGASKSMVKSMSEKELEKMAHTSRK